MGKWDFYEHHFGPARLAHYVTEFRGDVDRAADLYVWNISISAEMWRALAMFEVAFRNAIDRALSARHDRLGRPGHWIFDDAREIGRDANGPSRHRQPFVDVALAKERVRRNHKSLDAGQVVSELPFGFWHQMVSRRQLALWPDIASAFGYAPDRRQSTVQDPIRRIREIRNRIGHHHRVWSHAVGPCYEDLLAVAGYIDPDLGSFIDAHCAVTTVIALRPM